MQKGVFFSLVMSLGVLCANESLPDGIPHSNDFQTGRTKLPEKYEETGPDGIRLTNQSDPFPNKITPEMIECILRQHPEIADMVERLGLDESEIHPEAKDAIPSEMLLVGEPGVGKTTMAVALAIVLNRKVAFFRASSLAGNRFKDSGIEFVDEKLKSILDELKHSNENYVVIIDELSNLTSRYDGESNKADQTAISHLWGVFDAFKDSGRVFLIATANELSDLPETIQSRFEQNSFKIEKPDLKYRKEILRITLSTCHNLSNDQIESMAKKLDGLTNRQIVARVKEAKAIALKRDAKNFNVTLDDLIIAHEVLKERNRKSWTEWFNGGCKKHKNTIENLKMIGGGILIGSGIAAAVITAGPGALALLKIAAATKAGLATVAVAKASTPLALYVGLSVLDIKQKEAKAFEIAKELQISLDEARVIVKNSSYKTIVRTVF